MGDTIKNRILGFWSGHDGSFCVLKDGIPELHVELERHTRVKEGPGDSIGLFYELSGDVTDVAFLTTCHLDVGIKEHATSWNELKDIAPLYVCSHHQAHAAHAFYSSNYDDAVIITVDGGGIENERGFTAGATIWKGEGTQLVPLKKFPLEMINVGGVWTRTTRHVFGFETGFPFGNAAGSTMALAALAHEPKKYVKDFRRFMTSELQLATARAPGHVPGMSVKDPRNPLHPHLNKWKLIADADEKEKFNMAASLQLVTEEILENLVAVAEKLTSSKNVCFSGGVALNSVAMGKLSQRYEVYVPPVPYDGGLTLGSSQYVWHHVLNNRRINWSLNVSPYLGLKYSRDEVEAALKIEDDRIVVKDCTDDEVLTLLNEGKIVSIFHGRAESGRRALGNRSILADPRRQDAKDRVNSRVKSRQWFRPFAPSILRERVVDWFVRDVESPYMQFVVPFREEKKHLVPAVVHYDGTGRLQTVRREDNEWFYSLLKRWESKTGIPILLNTSYNSQEPIVERPEHAVACYLKTQIDHLYFPEHALLVTRK